MQFVTHCRWMPPPSSPHPAGNPGSVVVPPDIPDAAMGRIPAALAFADEAIVAITLAATVHRVVEGLTRMCLLPS